jgi:hypothetical protein
MHFIYNFCNENGRAVWWNIVIISTPKNYTLENVETGWFLLMSKSST